MQIAIKEIRKKNALIDIDAIDICPCKLDSYNLSSGSKIT